MEETEFEGGEACYILRDGDENANIDPDIALSYIDEKVQHVLGHFQKDFEGGVSAENLGAKFGGYGSFLPTYQRSPSVWSQPKSLGGSHNTRSTTTTTTTTNNNNNNNNSQFEGATKSSTMPPNAPSLGWHTTTSDVAKSLNSERLISIDVPAERESRLNSSQALGKLRIKRDASNKLDCFTDERNLKVRIKVGSDDLTRKTATIYSGLGLDISPSSSGNSAEETASLPSESLVTSHESPTSILQNSGFDFESNEIYFQAALKFLDVASLFETCDGDGKRNGEMTQIQIYIIAAKLCDSCAREYERCQEMAAAALAYKCMEVAYMWIVYCKHFSTGRLRNELQATLPMAPQGESPLSSASDVDNLNTQVSLEKAVLSKGMGPYVAGGQLTPQHRNFVLLLDFTRDVNMAMEASLKSQNAFAAAKGCLPEMHNKVFMTSVKRVIDFSFQDVGELVRLVRLAVEAISR